ncbi:hypothetical protein [Pseudooceanicola sp.]|uniref:hypothetical protein n=1 Tax=Pseudooceanicola sp. TaxID=1914328 RepID=UPI00405808D8
MGPDPGLGRGGDRCHDDTQLRPDDRALLPPEVQGVGGRHAIGESIMSGDQFAIEGYAATARSRSTAAI